MNEIVVCADVHEGINFGMNIDIETGISARALDIHENLKRIVDFAIQKESKLFVILGDLLDRTNVAPIYREMIRKDIIEPLRARKIKVWIIAGNHDQPHIFKRGTSISDFEDYDKEYVTVYRAPAVEKIDINGKKILFLILPYMHPEEISRQVFEKFGKEVERERIITLGQKIIKDWLEKNALGEADLKILLAHYYIDGAKLREVASPEVLPGEFSLPKQVIPQNLDIAVLGHVHLHQTLGKQGNTEIVYVGAVERIDWGEKDDEKGFIVLNPIEKKWVFEKLPVREMKKILVDLKPEEEPTEKILSFLDNVKNKMVRLEISLPSGLRVKVDENELRVRLKDAFHYEIKWTEKEEFGKVGLSEFTTNPFEMLKNFIELNYAAHPKKNDIYSEGMRILKEALE